jgi:arylsulfatase A-like enzyme
MKSQNWEGGIRVPFLIQWKGQIPAGHVSNQPSGVIDVYTTILKLIGLPLPSKLSLDGMDISSLLKSGSTTPHDALFSFYNDKLQTVRSGKWKLHINAPESSQLPFSADWIDPRLPDGVTILAPFEQPKATQFPGIKTGDPSAGGMLFDLEADPSEQQNVASKHPDIVKSLMLKAQRYQQQIKELN